MTHARTILARTALAVLLAVVAFMATGLVPAVTPAPVVNAMSMSMPDGSGRDDGILMRYASVGQASMGAVGEPMDGMRSECQGHLGCAKCFSPYAVDLWGPILYPPMISVELSSSTQTLRSRTGAPPFRPPRV